MQNLGRWRSYPIRSSSGATDLSDPRLGGGVSVTVCPGNNLWHDPWAPAEAILADVPVFCNLAGKVMLFDAIKIEGSMAEKTKKIVRPTWGSNPRP